MAIRLFGRDYRSQYDVIVIGSGVGGLVCANLLAQSGLKVLVIERHYVLGGYCSSFRRGKFIFDAATHFYPLLGNPTTLTGRLLQKLGSTTRWVKMDPVDQFHFPNGDRFLVPAEFSDYLARLKERFPGQAGQIDAFFKEVREAYLYGLLRYFKDVPNDRASSFESFTLEQKLDEHFQDYRLRALLMADASHWGSLPSRTSFVFDSILRLSYFLGNYYPVGGSQSFAEDLGRLLEDRGGHILLNGEVKKILTADCGVTGIRGTTTPRPRALSFEFRAPVVVSNADLIHTYTDLVGEENCGRAVIDRILKMRPTRPCFLMHLGLAGMERRVIEEAHGYHWFSWDPNDMERTFFKLFSPTLYEPRVAPPGHDILIVQKTDPVSWDSVTDWHAHKLEVEEQILSVLRRLIPGIDRNIVIKLSATPRTSYRFTNNYRGAMLGWEMTPDQLGDDRPANTTSIRNLFLAGHWTQPGGGITPVIVSAQRVAKLILAGSSSLTAETQRSPREDQCISAPFASLRRVRL